MRSTSFALRFLVGLVALVALVALASPARAQLLPAPGISAAARSVAPGNGVVGGMCRLPDGKLALFDGAKITAFDPESVATVTLYVPPSFVFGSFLVLEPGGQSLLFGESVGNTITRIPLSGGAASVVATVALNYDAAFDAQGRFFVSRGTATWGATEIVRVDLATGGLDLIATMPGPSGPLAFNAAGDLLYGENSPQFPAPLGSGTLWWFPQVAVAAAIGPASLTQADGVPFAVAVDVVSDLALDAEGDVVVSDSIHGRVYELSPAGTLRAEIATVPGGGATYLAFVDDSTTQPARFDPFQPPSGGTLAVIASDYSTYTDLVLVRPRRATMTTSPVSPVPLGPVALETSDGPPDGFLFLFAAAGAAPETPVHYQGVPYFFGLQPPIVFLGVLPLDAQGAMSLPATNPGVGATVQLQGALYGPPAGPLGTTALFPVTLQ